jgi:hypothetical protein
MALITCPDCGHSVSDRATFCVKCGCPAESQSSSPRPLPGDLPQQIVDPQSAEQANSRAASASVRLPLYPVATHKFVILSICTFGLYQLYWCYQNWKRLKAYSGESLSPFWRAVFAPLWNFSLFKRIRMAATSSGMSVGWNSGALATVYLVLNMSWRLPEAWGLISICSFIPMIPVQLAAQRVNERLGAESTESRNDTYNAVNITTIVIGGLLLILSIIGSFLL